MVIEPPVQHRRSAYGILSVIEIFQPHVLAISLLGGTYTALVPLHEQGESYQWPVVTENSVRAGNAKILSACRHSLPEKLIEGTIQ
jgi:hypothetical protein